MKQGPWALQTPGAVQCTTFGPYTMALGLRLISKLLYLTKLHVHHKHLAWSTLPAHEQYGTGAQCSCRTQQHLMPFCTWPMQSMPIARVVLSSIVVKVHLQSLTHGCIQHAHCDSNGSYIVVKHPVESLTHVACLRTCSTQVDGLSHLHRTPVSKAPSTSLAAGLSGAPGAGDTTKACWGCSPCSKQAEQSCRRAQVVQVNSLPAIGSCTYTSHL